MSLHLFLPFPPLKFPKYPSFPPNFPKYPSLKSPKYPLKPISVSTSSSYPDPSNDDPPEAPEDTAHGVSKFQQITRQSARARKIEEDDFEANKSTYLDAIRDVVDAPDDAFDDDSYASRTSDAIFDDIDKAISLKRKQFVEKGLLSPNPAPSPSPSVIDDVLDDDEVIDLKEIDELEPENRVVRDSAGGVGFDVDDVASFDYVEDLSGGDNGGGIRIVEPRFRMTLAELLDECKVVPVSVYGDLEVVITGIEHDSRLVNVGDLFVCCVGSKNDGHLFLSEADKRGAIAVVASKEIDIEETLGCKGLVLVDDTNAALGELAAAFYRWPTREMSVIGVTGTHGKTTIGYLVKGVYEAMGVKTGLMSSVAYYLHGENKLESPESSPDSVVVQKLMAKMLLNGTEAVVMEVSGNELGRGRCDEVDFDIAVFSNLCKDDSGFEGSEEEYKVAQGKLFSRMVDPDRHRKIVNIDDVNAPYFIGLGNSNVPVLTFALDNKDADVHPLKYELSLFETTVLVNTPQGILEISSGLLGKHNIYNILAAVAVGIAVGAPLEDIVRGIEEVDAVPGRCELIDEEQAFGVIVDHASTPNGLSRLLDSVRELNPRRIITVLVSRKGEKDLC